MSNVAQNILIPKDKNIFRIVFLYVGQGESTLLLIPDGNKYQYMLIDCNKSESLGGVNIAQLLKDLLGNNMLNVFVNTHPHKDHLNGLQDIIDNNIKIQSVWHSGHKPSKDSSEQYNILQKVIKKLNASDVVQLEGSNGEFEIGNVKYNIYAPAEYVIDDIKDEKPEVRDARIHEQCAVLRFKYGSPEENQILITGDADFEAWSKHIIYHKYHIQSTILSAVHHGSWSFFKKNEDDDNYMEHLQAINPTYIIVSAPKSTESKHGHPHKESMKIYKDFVDKKGAVLHLGEKKECIIVDININGTINLQRNSELVDEYGFKDKQEDNNKNEIKNFNVIAPSIDKKPMGL